MVFEVDTVRFSVTVFEDCCTTCASHSMFCVLEPVCSTILEVCCPWKAADFSMVLVLPKSWDFCAEMKKQISIFEESKGSVFQFKVFISRIKIYFVMCCFIHRTTQSSSIRTVLCGLCNKKRRVCSKILDQVRISCTYFLPVIQKFISYKLNFMIMMYNPQVAE